MSLDLNRYLSLRDEISRRGYAEEIEWSRSIPPVEHSFDFWCEFAFVVLNSGMKAQVAQGIWDRVRAAVLSGGRAGDVFGHKGKAAAIDYVWKHRDRLLEEYLGARDKIENLKSLPWIGDITCWHLAKNFGLDCAKPDRHLVRIAGDEGVVELCSRLAKLSGDRIATVDLVIWRAANLRLI